MLGRSKESLEAARSSIKAVPPEMLDMMPGMDFFASEPLLVMVRFGMWDLALKEPRPPEKYKTLLALWLTRAPWRRRPRGSSRMPRRRWVSSKKLVASLPEDLTADQNKAKSIAEVGAKAVEARLAEKEHKVKDAIKLWEEAVGLEDGLAYSEPADGSIRSEATSAPSAGRQEGQGGAGRV